MEELRALLIAGKGRDPWPAGAAEPRDGEAERAWRHLAIAGYFFLKFAVVFQSFSYDNAVNYFSIYEEQRMLTSIGPNS